MNQRILTLDEQTRLYRAWHDHGDADALADLLACIRMGLDRFAIGFAKKWRLPVDDMLSAVSEIALETINRGDWDPSRSNLASWLMTAVRWRLRIEGGLHQTIPDRTDNFWRFGMLAVQDHEEARRAMAKRLCMEISDKRLAGAIVRGQAQVAVRLDQAVMEGGGTYSELIPSLDAGPEELAVRGELASKVRAVADAVRSGLDAKMAAVLDRRILADEPATLDALAADFGVSRERIRQREIKVMKALAGAMAAAGITPDVLRT